MDFVKLAYLPEKRTKIAVGNVCDETVKMIKPYREEKLADSLSYHADLSFCYLGENVAISTPESYEYYKKALLGTGLEIRCGVTSLDRHYPKDSAYNVAILGRRMFCKVEITDPVLLESAKERGYEIIDIKQGYAKCSVCPIDENSAISADVSFLKSAQKAGVDVLHITNESIVLDGYSNGFFGGCAYMRDKKTLCVLGDLKTHPDCERIEEFLKRRNIKIECLKKGEPLYDFGSFIPLFEE